MRLINTTSFKIEEFFGANIPKYAILSHTWGDAEVTFHDWLYAHGQTVSTARWLSWARQEQEVSAIKATAGYKKVVEACRKAKSDGHEWVWVDTNCIDKTSSAELSEAINSMFKWYRDSQVCYVYLEDVEPMSIEDAEKPESRFRASRWFTRGWTLQELVAPDSVWFLAKDWSAIGSIMDIPDLVAEITSVSKGVLGPRDRFPQDPYAPDELERYSIAERMSWASRRQTTREEDMAYCLLGIFNVNMALLYGEGEAAFQRLQQELIKKISDQTFLLWTLGLPYQTSANYHGKAARDESIQILAQHPRQFAKPREMAILNKRPRGFGKKWGPPPETPTIFTNLGLEVSMPLVPTIHPQIVFGVIGKTWSGWHDETRSDGIAYDAQLWIPLYRRNTETTTAMERVVCFRQNTPSSTIVGPVEPREVTKNGDSDPLDNLPRPLPGALIPSTNILLRETQRARIIDAKISETDLFTTTRIADPIVGVILAFPGATQTWMMRESYPEYDPDDGFWTLETDLTASTSMPVTAGSLNVDPAARQLIPRTNERLAYGVAQLSLSSWMILNIGVVVWGNRWDGLAQWKVKILDHGSVESVQDGSLDLFEGAESWGSYDTLWNYRCEVGPKSYSNLELGRLTGRWSMRHTILVCIHFVGHLISGDHGSMGPTTDR